MPACCAERAYSVSVLSTDLRDVIKSSAAQLVYGKGVCAYSLQDLWALFPLSLSFSTALIQRQRYFLCTRTPSPPHVHEAFSCHSFCALFHRKSQLAVNMRSVYEKAKAATRPPAESKKHHTQKTPPSARLLLYGMRRSPLI